MIFGSVRHEGLLRLVQDDDPRFLAPNLVDRVRKVLTAMVLAENPGAFITDAPPGWRVHKLSGNRKDEWSVSISGNWRITFEEQDGAIYGLNLEDYH